ncbi:MAG: 5' nucleotidase, NT5C type [Chitinophagaceae bacterium]
METLAIDMDEVIADPTSRLVDWYERDFGIRLTEDQLLGKHVREAVPSQHAPIIFSYLNTPGFFQDLPVLRDSKEVLEELQKKYQLFIVSAALEFPNSLKDKVDWLKLHFPFISWQQICLCGNKGIIQTDIMVDDHSRNFKFFKGRKILFTAHHNIFEQGYERVNNWEEASKILL